MKVSDLFSKLSLGELNGLAMALDGSGNIDELFQPKVLKHANDALTALYTRFPHKTDYVKIELQEDLHKYYLQAQFAASDTDVGNTNPRYILDSAEEPFDPRVSKIISISDSDAECWRDEEILINDPSHGTAVKKISFDGFYVKEPVAENVYMVEYQCLHPILSEEEPDEDADIFLAPVLYEALTARIASSIYAGIGNEDAIAKSVSYGNIYEGICIRAEADDTLQMSSSNNHDKLREGGWE